MRALRILIRFNYGVFVATIGLFATGLARAHDPGLSTVQGTWKADSLELTAGFALNDAQQLVALGARGAGRFSATDFERMKPAFETAASMLWDARANGQILAPLSSGVELLPGDNVSLIVRFSRPKQTGSLTLLSRQIGLLPAGHLQFITITDEQGAVLAKRLLSIKEPVIDVPIPGGNAVADRTSPTFFGFLRLGVEHIWTGYDHLLFLFALLVVCRTFRSIVTIVSCFTLAHSLTLALATLNVINLPSRITEPAIAASIVVVGLENLFSGGTEPRARWALTFAFGLVHGFGFASVLRDLGVGGRGQGIAMPLFTFNLGVEIGQIAIAAFVLPFLWRLRKQDRFIRRGVPILSGAVSVVGLYWFLQRTVFS